MEHIAVYFTGDIDPDTNDTRLELIERPAHDEAATITSYQWTLPAGATPVRGETDPTLAVFYEPQDQGDGK